MPPPERAGAVPPAPDTRGAVDRLLAGQGVETRHVTPPAIEAERQRVRQLGFRDRRALSRGIADARRATTDRQVHSGLDDLQRELDATRARRGRTAAMLALAASPFVIAGGALMAAANRNQGGRRRPGSAGTSRAPAAVPPATPATTPPSEEEAGAQPAALEDLPPTELLNGREIAYTGADDVRRTMRITPGAEGQPMLFETGGVRYGVYVRGQDGRERPMPLTALYPADNGSLRFLNVVEAPGMGEISVSTYLSKDQMDAIQRALAAAPATGTEPVSVNVTTTTPQADIRTPGRLAAGLVDRRLRAQGARVENGAYVMQAAFVFRRVPASPTPPPAA